MSVKQRLGFPTKFAKEQCFYEVEDGTNMYVFDHVTQFIYRVSFKLGQIAGDGLDEYVSKNYSAVEKKFKVDNYDILFSRRDFRVVGAEKTTYTCQVNSEFAPYAPTSTYRHDQKKESYIFLNDQLIYDPQLKNDAFNYRFKSEIEVDVNQNYPVTGSHLNDLARNKAKVERFIPYSQYVKNPNYDHRYWDMKKNPTYDPKYLTVGHTDYDPANPDAKEWIGKYPEFDRSDSRAIEWIHDPTITQWQSQLSNKIMKDKAWIRKFAQKHFLCIFRSNNVMENPRIFYGFPIKDLRIHPYDQVKY